MHEPSKRIIDQRVRNRIMEAVYTLAKGDDGVREVWPTDYFESFYDWLPHRDHGGIRPNSAITTQERVSLMELSRVLDDACDATLQIMDADELIATGWPMRIKPIAQCALTLMLNRGRFNEDNEEIEPSPTEAWPSAPDPAHEP